MFTYFEREIQNSSQHSDVRGILQKGYCLDVNPRCKTGGLRFIAQITWKTQITCGKCYK